jgi:hypothetical protein
MGEKYSWLVFFLQGKCRGVHHNVNGVTPSILTLGGNPPASGLYHSSCGPLDLLAGVDKPDTFNKAIFIYGMKNLWEGMSQLFA